MAPRISPPNYKPQIRCQGKGTNWGLGAGAVTSNGGIRYEVHAVGGCARFKARIKVSGNGGQLDAIFVGPDVDLEVLMKNDVAFASIVGTLYASGNPASVAVAAGTEAQIFADCYGEGFVLLKYTGATGAGAITYCDIGRV